MELQIKEVPGIMEAVNKPFFKIETGFSFTACLSVRQWKLADSEKKKLIINDEVLITAKIPSMKIYT